MFIPLPLHLSAQPLRNMEENGKGNLASKVHHNKIKIYLSICIGNTWGYQKSENVILHKVIFSQNLKTWSLFSWWKPWHILQLGICYDAMLLSTLWLLLNMIVKRVIPKVMPFTYCPKWPEGVTRWLMTEHGAHALKISFLYCRYSWRDALASFVMEAD